MSVFGAKVKAAHDSRKVKRQKVSHKELVDPETGKPIEFYIQGMTGLDRDAWDEYMLYNKGDGDRVSLSGSRAKLVVMCGVDENGTRLFDDDDLDTLNSLDAKIIDKWAGIAQNLSGLRTQDVEEILGNLRGDRNGSSHSDSALQPVA